VASELDARLQSVVWALGLPLDEFQALKEVDPDRYFNAALWREGAALNLDGSDIWEKWPQDFNPLQRCDPNGFPVAPFTDGQLRQFDANREGTEYFLVAWWAAAASLYYVSTGLAVQEHNAIAAARNATNLAVTYLAAGRSQAALMVCLHVMTFTAQSNLGHEMLSIRREAITIARMGFASQGGAHQASDNASWLEHEPPEMKRMFPQVRSEVSGALRRVGEEGKAREWEALYDAVARLSAATAAV